MREICDERIDGGKSFDWGRTAADYAKYRDIYPQELYEKITGLGLCVSGQQVLDLGTGTGVLPRNLYHTGAHFVGTDIAAGQIEQAKRLAAQSGMDIEFVCMPSEAMDFPARAFDVVSACQCFFYFDHEVVAPKIHTVLKDNGSLLVIFMAWLPQEDPIAGASEELVLRYSPSWTGKGETRRPIHIPENYRGLFRLEHSEVFDVRIPFTRESWNGRIKACRGVGASLMPEQINRFEEEHMELLKKAAPETFEILHYCAIRVLRPIK